MLAALATLGLAWSGRGYTADDAFITGRYALRLARGDGYTFRDGAPTDGVTGPLLLALEAPSAWIGLDPVTVSKLAGALAVALAVYLSVARLRTRASGSLASWLAVLGIVVSGPLALHAQSGLETGLATLLVTGAVLGATARPGSARASGVVALGLALVPWLRPELVPALWTVGALAVVRDRRSLLPLALAAVLGLASVVAFRALLFGSVIPLSAQAKPTDLGNGLGYALAGLSVAFGLMLVPALHAARTSRLDGLTALVVVVHSVAVVLGGGDWMPGARLLVPLAPTVVALFALGAARFARSRRRPAAIVALVLAMLVPQGALTVAILSQAGEVARSRSGPGAYLRDLLDRESRVVALIDIGFFTYRAQWDVLDLAGVTDPAIGMRPGAHCAKEVTLDDLLARGVDTLVVHSGVEPQVDDEGRVRHVAAHPTEERLLRDPRTSELFYVTRSTQYAERYWYLVLRRRPETLAPSRDDAEVPSVVP